MWAPCTKDCLAKFGDPDSPNFNVEKFRECLNICGIVAQAAYDGCLGELDRCVAREPREKPRFEELPKKGFNPFGAVTFGFGGTCIGAAVSIYLAPKSNVALSVGVAVFGAFLMIMGGNALAKADDPVDSRYKSLARPSPPKPFSIKAKAGTPIDADVAQAINAVLKNQADAIGVDRAIVTSINRAQGASVAEEPHYEKLQMQNARRYAGELAILLRQSGGLRSKAVVKLRDNGVTFSINEEQAYKIRAMLVKNRLPPKCRGIVLRYCRNESERKDVLRRILSQLYDVHQFEVTFPDFLARPKLASAEKKMAAVLEEFSKSTYVSL
jgi:hypothetical protein